MNNINTIVNISKDQALRNALIYAGIENDGPRCTGNVLQDGYYRINVWTAYLKYDFYVDAQTGEVSGIDIEPVSYDEPVCLPHQAAIDRPAAA